MTTPQSSISRFGALLKQYRRATGLTQEALAERAHLSERAIQAIERGVSQSPRADTVALLAAALELAPAERAALEEAARGPAARPAVISPMFPAPPASRPPGAEIAPVPGTPSPLVGREREVALLDAVLDATHAAEPDRPLLLLAGEPGIGKTRLLQAAAQRAITAGWTVLAGGCHRRGGQQPYSPLLDALARYLHAVPPDRLRGALAGCAWLVRLLPELTALLEPLPAGTVPPEQERRLLFAAVARLLANVAGPAGTLLLLDDLQWAGSDALDLLAALIHTPSPPSGSSAGAGGAGRLRIVGAYRDTEVRPDDPLGHLRADLARAGLIRHHALGPLEPQDAAELLADLLAEGGPPGLDAQAVAPRVLARVGGTPFFLVSYAQALRAAREHGQPQGHGGQEQRPSPSPPPPGLDTVPWDVTEGVRQRVALLPEAARRLLGVAAVVGRRAPWALLVAVCGQPEDEVLAGLEAAVQARLVLEDESGAYTFAHDLIREVVEADVGAARRAVLHRRVAEALERDSPGAAVEVIAYHYTRAGRDEQALPYLEQAGDQAWASRAHGAAEGHYRALLDRLDHLGRATEAARVREKLGLVLHRFGRYDMAVEVLEQAADTCRAAADWTSVARITARIGWLHSLRGTPQAGLALIQPLLALLEQQEAALVPAALYATAGQLLFTTGHYEASLPASERAAALARASGDTNSWVLAEYNRMNILQLLGRLGEAVRIGQEIVVLADPASHSHNLVAVLRDLAFLHALQGAFEQSHQYIDQACLVAEGLEEPGQIALTLATRSWIVALRGDWPRAGTEMDKAMALSRQAGQSWYSPYVLHYRARLLLAEGAWADASAALEEAGALTERSGDLQARRWAATVAAELDVCEGRPEAAVARLEPLRDRPGLEECDVTTLLPVLAWAYLELYRLDEAAATVEQALARARPEEMRLVLVEALRVQALLALRREQWEAAAHSLEEGLTLACAMPYPYAEARLLHVHGQMHAQKRELQLARRRLEAARALFAHLGARADVLNAERALAALPRAAHAQPAQAQARPVVVRRKDGSQPGATSLSRADRQAWVLAHLRTAGALSPRGYAAALGISLDTAWRDLSALTRQRAIEAQGTTKDRRYVLRHQAD